MSYPSICDNKPGSEAEVQSLSQEGRRGLQCSYGRRGKEGEGGREESSSAVMGGGGGWREGRTVPVQLWEEGEGGREESSSAVMGGGGGGRGGREGGQGWWTRGPKSGGRGRRSGGGKRLPWKKGEVSY